MDAGISTDLNPEYVLLIDSDSDIALSTTLSEDTNVAQAVPSNVTVVPQNQGPESTGKSVLIITVVALPSGVYSTETPARLSSSSSSSSQPLTSSVVVTSLAPIIATFSSAKSTSISPVVVTSSLVSKHSSSSSRADSSTRSSSSATTSLSSVSSSTTGTRTADSATSKAIVATTTDSPRTLTIVSTSWASGSTSSVFTDQIANSSDITAVASGTISSSSSGQFPSATSPNSNLVTHNPPFYIGLVLGCIAAMAIICALVAWCIRFRYARRRRAVETQVPWSNGDEGDGGLEEGRTTVDTSTNITQGSDNGENMNAWELHGDRDVGEPKRTDSYDHHASGFLRNHHIPTHEFFSDGIGNPQSKSQDDVYPHVRKPTLRQLPSHLVDEKLLTRHLNNNGFDQSGGEYGTPREGVDIPRFLNLRGEGMEVPWHTTGPQPQPRSMAERLRRLNRPPNEIPTWQRLSPILKNPDKGVEDQKEGWTASITSNLVNAFNAVAANIPALSGGEEKDRDNTSLTPIPSKRGPRRKSIKFAFDTDKILGRGDLMARSDTSSSKSSSKSSYVPWTLEERGDGVGVVHVHVPGLGIEDYTSSPLPLESILSFGEKNDDMSGLKEATSLSRPLTHESQIPLVVSTDKPPSAALIRTDVSSHCRDQPDLGLAQIARELSWNHHGKTNAPLALASRNSSDDGTNFMRRPTLPLKINAKRGLGHYLDSSNLKEGDGTVDSRKKRPSLAASRTSSSNTSVASSCSTVSGYTDRQTSEAKSALRARRGPASPGQ